MVAQRLVAAAIARALGTFCELDESAVQSNLLNKARITLNNLRLKPRVIKQTNDFSIVLHGKIKTCIFKWKWSGKGLLRKCTFIVTGLRITLKPVSKGSEQSLPSKEKSDKKLKLDMEMEMDDSKKDKKNWKDKLALRILEQLAVSIEDLEIAIETPRNILEENMPWKRIIMLSGKDIRVESLGRVNQFKKRKNLKFGKGKVMAPLLQELKIGSLSAKVLIVHKDGNADAFPLLLPFQYLALGRRVHGNRFSSFTTGLEVEGKHLSPMRSRSHASFIKRDDSSVMTDSSIQQSPGSDDVSTSLIMEGELVEVFADLDEVETSLCCSQVSPMSQTEPWSFMSRVSLKESRDDEFLEVEIQSDFEATDELHLVLGDEQLLSLFSVLNMFKNDDTQEDEEDISYSHYRNTFMRPGALKHLSKVSPSSFKGGTRTINKTSKFNFPFPFVHVSLPGNVAISAEDCVIKLKADNSVFKIYGTGEISIDNETFLHNGAMWTVDLLKKETIIEPYNNGSLSNHWDWKFNQSEDESKTPLMVDCAQVNRLKGFVATVLEKKRLTQRRHAPNTQKRSSSSWSLNLKGNTTFKF